MRLSALVVASSLFVGSGLAPGSASAGSPLPYSYEVENADAAPDRVLVLWPRTCQASGGPLGSIDFALNPDWASRMNEVDYEVVVKGKTHRIVEHCVETARLFALPANEFVRGTRPSTADDTAIGQAEAGVPFTILPALDAVDLKKRVELFDSDPRVLKSSFRFAAPKVGASGTKLKSVHDVLALDGFGATAFSVVAKHVIYTYEDGSIETRSYVGASRPEALREKGDAGAADGGPGIPVTDGGATAPSASPTLPHDGSSRFVYIAAVGGLVVGGIIAFLRKKRAPR